VATIPRFSPAMPTERAVYELDFVDWLPVGATIASATVAVETNTSPPVTSASLVPLGPVVVNGTKVAIPLTGGVAGRDYLISYTAELSDGGHVTRSAALFILAQL
jgi:hypothetical protein